MDKHPAECLKLNLTRVLPKISSEDDRENNASLRSLTAFTTGGLPEILIIEVLKT